MDVLEVTVISPVGTDAVPKWTAVTFGVPLSSNPLPVMVTVVPPATGPAVGWMLVTTVLNVAYVNVTGGVLLDVPPTSDTVTSVGPVPGAGMGLGGVTAVIVVELTTTTSVALALVPPGLVNVTAVVVSPGLKFVPVIVTAVPPATGPWLGTMPLTLAIVGATS